MTSRNWVSLKSYDTRVLESSDLIASRSASEEFSFCAETTEGIERTTNTARTSMQEREVIFFMTAPKKVAINEFCS